MSSCETTSNVGICSPEACESVTAIVRGPGSVPEWPKGTVCKTVAQASLVRTQPGPPGPQLQIGPSTDHPEILVRSAARPGSMARDGRTRLRSFTPHLARTEAGTSLVRACRRQPDPP